MAFIVTGTIIRKYLFKKCLYIQLIFNHYPKIFSWNLILLFNNYEEITNNRPHLLSKKNSRQGDIQHILDVALSLW